MEFFKEDVNRILIALLIVHLLLFVGLTVYFQYSLMNIKKEYNLKEQQLETLIKQTIYEQLDYLEKVKSVTNLQKDMFGWRYYECMEELRNISEEDG